MRNKHYLHASCYPYNKCIKKSIFFTRTLCHSLPSGWLRNSIHSRSIGGIISPLLWSLMYCNETPNCCVSKGAWNVVFEPETWFGWTLLLFEVNCKSWLKKIQQRTYICYCLLIEPYIVWKLEGKWLMGIVVIWVKKTHSVCKLLSSL